MGRSEQLKSDLLRPALLMGLCSAIGIYLILTTPLITRDGVFYIEQARQIAQDPTGVCRRYPPGYPFLLWASHAVASLFAEGDSPMLWARSAQAVTLLCRVLALIPLYLLGRLLVGAAHSFWALLVLVVLPYPAFYGSDVLREWPYILFLSTGMLLLYGGLSTRRWWVLGLVGLIAGLGYLIRPECIQLVAYALLGLFAAHESSSVQGSLLASARRFLAGPLLIAGFIVPVAPYVHAGGSLVPHQLRPSTANLPPVLSTIGPKAAGDMPLEFEARVGEWLELPIRAADPDGGVLAFSLAGMPAGSRPVYAFRSMAVGAEFWTVSGPERERLIAACEVWDCEGIAWYAYDRPDARPGLLPVYRFWSPTRGRHFFTMSESERQAILVESAPEPWVDERAAFYAFGERDRPADTVPIFRLGNEEKGYSWTTKPPAGTDAQSSTIAWYAYPAREPPAGARIENAVFRWCPTPGQEGEHLLNIIVTDGKLPCSQLMTIRVVRTGSARQNPQAHGSRLAYASAGMAFSGQTRTPGEGERVLLSAVRGTLDSLVNAVDDTFDGIAEDLMVIAVLPWILGLCLRLKNRATPLERILIAAVLIINLGLMLSRHIWIAPGSARRYSVAMIALTIFYLPAGVDVMTRVLNRTYVFRGRLAELGAGPRSLWFYLLMAGAVALCTPKLIYTPLRAEKAGYRTAGEWLRRNTLPEAVVAAPDSRTSFYAERPQLLYKQYPNWRNADFVVEITGGGRLHVPEGWSRVYSVAVEPGSDSELVIYGKAVAGANPAAGNP